MEKGNKSMMIVIIALLVVLLAAIGGLSVFAFTTLSNMQKQATEPQLPVAVGLPLKDQTVYDIGETMTNLLVGTDGKKYMFRVTVSIFIDKTNKKNSDAFVKFLTDDDVGKTVFKDAINDVLHNTTNDDLKTPEQIDELKVRLLETFRDRFDAYANLIYGVGVTDHVVAAG